MVTINVNVDLLRKQAAHPQLLLDIPGKGFLCTICDRRQLRKILSPEKSAALGITDVHTYEVTLRGISPLFMNKLVIRKYWFGCEILPEPVQKPSWPSVKTFAERAIRF